MSKRFQKCRSGAALLLALLMIFSIQAFASDDDNSLYSLGIQTEGVTVEPEFSYDVWSYTVTVPGGTKELSLDPVPSSSSASISGITGTELGDDGTGYVTITVTAGNGSAFTYELNVVSDGTVPVTEAETETETQPQTEPVTEKATEAETEDPQIVRVHRDSIEEAANTITNLKDEITVYRDKISLFTKIMFGLIGLCIILLFIVINLLLKKKDLKAELNDYRSLGYSNSKKAQKAQAKAMKKAEKEQRRQSKQGSGQELQEAQYSQPYNQPYGTPVSPTLQQIPPQNDSHLQAQQTYADLDVKPQKSQKRNRNLPQYEQPMGVTPAQYQTPQQPLPQEYVQNTANSQPAANAPGGAGDGQKRNAQQPDASQIRNAAAQQPDVSQVREAAAQEASVQAAQQAGAQPQNQPVQPQGMDTQQSSRKGKTGRGKKSGKKDDVEINMIDL